MPSIKAAAPQAPTLRGKPLPAVSKTMQASTPIPRLSCLLLGLTLAAGVGAEELLVSDEDVVTTLAARQGGEMPFWRVYETISGSELLPAHGSRDMPIWGEAFARESSLTGLEPATYTRGRIFNLLAWLRVIQRTPATP